MQAGSPPLADKQCSCPLSWPLPSALAREKGRSHQDVRRRPPQPTSGGKQPPAGSLLDYKSGGSLLCLRGSTGKPCRRGNGLLWAAPTTMMVPPSVAAKRPRHPRCIVSTSRRLPGKLSLPESPRIPAQEAAHPPQEKNYQGAAASRLSGLSRVPTPRLVSGWPTRCLLLLVHCPQSCSQALPAPVMRPLLAENRSAPGSIKRFWRQQEAPRK